MVFKITMIDMFKIIQIVKYFNTYLLVIHRISHTPKNKNTKDSNNTINKLNFSNLYRIPKPTTETTYSSKVHETFTEISHMWFTR